MYRHRLVLCAACAGAALWLSSCAGGANLYAEPVDTFEEAVADTDTAVSAFAVLAGRQNEAVTVDRALTHNAKATYAAMSCTTDTPAAQCTVTIGAAQDGSSGAPFAAERAMLAKLGDYARTLGKIANIARAQDLRRRQGAADAAYKNLLDSVKAATKGDAGAAEGAFKSAVKDGLGSLYLESKRTKLLHALVDTADPVVAKACDVLGRLLESRRDQFIRVERTQVAALVDEYGMLGQHPDGAKRTVLRRQTLIQARAHAERLRAVIATPMARAFTDMKDAHAELRAALALADSDTGKVLVAMDNFSASAARLSRVYAMAQSLF